jgi:glycosyltransferase involved in cell wall biosynthesis
MPRPLVTIISPAYNQERYIAACVESALAQTYPHWEQIFVDDGSNDRTRDILAQYDDPRIRVLALSHAGLGALERSYNTALAASRGSLVAILEGDDRWPADKLEVQVPSFDAPDTFLTWGYAALIDEHDAVVGNLARADTRVARTRVPAREAFHRLTRSNFLSPTVTVMVRREALERIGGFRQTGSSLLVDLPTWLWVTAREDGFVEFVNHCLGLYRVHDGQTSRQRRALMIREHISVVKAVEAELGSSTLGELGWDAAAQRRAESRAHLAEGEIALEAGLYAEARAAFVRVLRGAPAAADMALALAGVVSSLMRLNFVRAAFSAREWTRRRQHGRQPAATRN